MASKDDKDKKIADDAERLYMAVATASVDHEGRRSKSFNQEALLGFAELDNTKELMPLIQHLANQNLFRTLKVAGKLGWSVRPREAAKQIATLDKEEKMIYEVVEEAHTNGVWTKDIKKRLALAQNTITKALTKMEKSRLIKGIKNVKSPAQRTYMLYHLQPSEDVIGNSFYDAGDLDESFRDELMNLIVFHIRGNSWIELKKKSHRHEPSSPTLHADDLDSANKKRKRTSDIEDIAQPTKYRSLPFDPERDFTQLVHKAGTHNYPTADETLEFLRSTQAIKPAKAALLTVQEIQGCIDVLCWDEKLEKVPRRDGLGWGYRTVRGVTYKQPEFVSEYEYHPGTGFTQAPCGRCPVFDLCHEDGPVNPRECVYFEEWLRDPSS